MKKVFIALFGAVLLLSCGGEKKNSPADGVEEKISEECVSPTNKVVPSSPNVNKKDVKENVIVVAEEVEPLVVEEKAISPSLQDEKIVDVINVLEDEFELEDEELDEIAAVDELEEMADDETIYEVVDENPEFPGGMKKLVEFLGNNMKYPRISRDNGSQGRVFVRFVVNADGSIQDAEILRSSGDMYLDEEALRLVAIMPKWVPGREKGKPVRVRFVLPVNFRLQ
jgi:protein TonB